MNTKQEHSLRSASREHHTRTALVTGGNGFIGRTLVKHLVEEGYTVHATAHAHHEALDCLLPQTNIHKIPTQALAAELVADLKPFAIFHLAAHSFQSRTLSEMTEMLESNVQFGISLLHGATLCQSLPIFVNAGTYWQYADPSFDVPNSFYAATKQAFHDFLLQFRRTFELRAVTLVLFDTIGPADPRQKLWNELAKAVPGSSFALSAGEQEIALVHVDDVARAFVHAANLLFNNPASLPLQTYALRSSQVITLRVLLESLKQQGLLDLQFKWGELPYPKAQIFKLWSGEQLPGWVPVHDIFRTFFELTRNNLYAAGMAPTS